MKNAKLLNKTYSARKKISNYCLFLSRHKNDGRLEKVVMRFEKWIYPEGVIESW